ncbi:endonuclease/exonuclease/phosphatase family protein [Planctomycetes bacterium K23_9]
MMTTIATLFSRVNWLADLCANLRVQQMIALVPLTIVVVLFRRWSWFAICMVLVAVHVPAFRTAWKVPPAGGVQGSKIVVMTANVWTPNSQHELIVQQIRDADPDVFTVLELGTPLKLRLEKELAALYPHQFAFPQDDGNFGIGLYSKHPLEGTTSFALNNDRVLSLAATVMVDSRRYRVFATHPLPPKDASNFQSRNTHLDQLAAKVRLQQESDDDVSVIIMGDLNLTPWSPLFDRFQADTQTHRASCGNGITPTWYAHADASFPFGLVLDHVLTSDDLRCDSYRVGPAIGSDHRAVIVSLSGQ